MKIDNLKDLEKLVKLCRKVGINAIKIDGIEFVLTSAKTSAKQTQQTEIPDFTISNNVPLSEQNQEVERIQTPDELTEEQLLYYSAASSEQIN